MADDARPPINEAGKGADPGQESRESLGEFLSKHPVVTVAVAVCVGAVVANSAATLFGGRRRALLERSAYNQLRMAQRLDPYGDPLA